MRFRPRGTIGRGRHSVGLLGEKHPAAPVGRRAHVYPKPVFKNAGYCRAPLRGFGAQPFQFRVPSEGVKAWKKAMMD